MSLTGPVVGDLEGSVDGGAVGPSVTHGISEQALKDSAIRFILQVSPSVRFSSMISPSPMR